ncbi:SLAM family member 5 isoform X3 [Castor canadensis]|uniref:SLAM family member 5 isoform X3 n=1 Tax=Castor canadensis TaxID=51338 RepID=A0AC58KFX3_CASCN
MAGHHLSILFLCLQTWPEAAGRHTDVLLVNGILGESVIFPSNIEKSLQVISISWNSKTSVAFINPGDSGTVTPTHKNYYGRINLIGQNYDLVLSNLRMEDAGDYKADINTNTDTITKYYHLQVYRRLGKPKITQSLMTSVNNTCNVTLTCSMEKEEKNVTYSWSPPGEGNVLQILQTSVDQELTYTCTAWNPVSNNSDFISSQQLCADVVMGFRTRRTGLLSGVTVFCLIILGLCSVFLFRLCKRRQGSYLKTFTKSSGSRDILPAESRLYDEIPQQKGKMDVFQVLPSNEGPMNTIYSTVQNSDKMGKTIIQECKPPRTSGYEIVV